MANRLKGAVVGMIMEQSWYLDPVKKLSAKHRQRACDWQLQLTKPSGSLGRLEDLATELAAMQHTKHPHVKNPAICIFAADQGVCAESVSAYPQAVTAQMLANFAAGGAAINVIARMLHAELEVVNLGTVVAVESSVKAKREITVAVIASQSGNIAVEAAMSSTQLSQALARGGEALLRAKAKGCDLFIGGEMGIGNTTTAAALLSRLLDTAPAKLVGPGTGIDTAGVAHKLKVIEAALRTHHAATDPLEALRCLGGFEIGALVGSYIAAAQQGIAVLVDGFICTAAAMVAVRINPEVRHWLLLAHTSAEPGHRLAVAALDKRPLLDLGMRLGEGSGAGVAVPLLKMACELHNNMATFTEAGVATKS